MLDQYQFTLLIVAVGLAAYLASLYEWHRDKIDLLTTQVTALEKVPLGDKNGGNNGIREATEEQKEKISERLDHFTLRLQHSAVSVLLLISFVTLLACRIFLWSWQRQPDSTQSRAPMRLLWLDRALISVLVVLLLQICALHLVGDLPSVLSSSD